MEKPNEKNLNRPHAEISQQSGTGSSSEVIDDTSAASSSPSSPASLALSLSPTPAATLATPRETTQQQPPRNRRPIDVDLIILSFYGQGFLDLRRISKDWNASVIAAHGIAHGKQTVCCSLLEDFRYRHSRLPWMQKWRIYGSHLVQSGRKDHQNDRLLPSPQKQPMEGDHQEVSGSAIESVSLYIDQDTSEQELNMLRCEHVGQVKTLTVCVSHSPSSDSLMTDKSGQAAVHALDMFGGVEAVHLKDRRFDYAQGAQHFADLMRSWPKLKSITFDDCGLSGQHMNAFAGAPLLQIPPVANAASLESLVITNNPMDQFPFTIFSRCHLPALRRLVLDGLRVSDVGDGADWHLQLPAGQTSLPSLKSLVLQNCKLNGPIVEEILSLPFADNLAHLDIRWNRFTQAQLASLLVRIFDLERRTRQIKTIECLNVLSGNASEFSRHLFHVGAAGQLHVPLPQQRAAGVELSFGNKGEMQDETMHGLMLMRSMQSVRKLQIQAGRDQDPLQHVFDRNSCFTNLQVLEAWSDAIRHDGLRCLTQSPLAQNLRILKLYTSRRNGPLGGHLDDECCKLLAESKMLQNLEELTLHETTMTIRKGFVPLLTSENLPSLRRLECECRQVGRRESTEQEQDRMDTYDVARGITKFLRGDRGRQFSLVRFPHSQFSQGVMASVRRSMIRDGRPNLIH